MGEGKTGYVLGDSDPFTKFPKLEAGSNILISGPLSVGKSQLLVDSITHGDSTGIVLTTDDKVLDLIDGQISRMKVISASGDRNSSDSFVPNSYADPQNLMDIGMAIIEQLNQVHEPNPFDAFRVGIYNISDLLVYHELKTVFQFLTVWNSRVNQQGILGIGCIHSSSHSPEELSTIRSVFDGIIRVREDTNGYRELQAEGLQGENFDWQNF